MGMTLRFSTTAASGALAAGTSNPSRFSAAACSAMASTPLIGRVSPVRRQLADDGEGAGPLEGDLAAAKEQSQRDRQVEPARVLLQVGGGQVDHDPIDRPAVSRIDDRPLDPVRALAHRGLRQAHQDRLGIRGEGDIDLDLDRGRVDSDERVRGELREHGRLSAPGATSIAGDAPSVRSRPFGRMGRFYHELMVCSPPSA